MTTPISDSPLAILTFIAAPAVFTNAASVLALGTGNRLARVVDRTRQLSAELRRDNSDTALNRMYLRQLGRLGRRSDRLVRAMTFFYTAVGAFAAASLVAVVGASLGTTHYQLPFEVVAFFSLGQPGMTSVIAPSNLAMPKITRNCCGYPTWANPCTACGAPER